MKTAAEILRTHAPLQKGTYKGQPIILNKHGWPLELISREEMEALIDIVNERCSQETTDLSEKNDPPQPIARQSKP